MSSNGTGPKAESKFKVWFRQFFCDHIYSSYKEESIGVFKRFIGGIDVGYVEKFAVYERCLKCGKKRITETKGLAI